MGARSSEGGPVASDEQSLLLSCASALSPMLYCSANAVLLRGQERLSIDPVVFGDEAAKGTASDASTSIT